MTGDQLIAGRLRDLLGLKDTAHYGLHGVARDNARTAVRKAAQLLEAARERVR